MRPCDPTPLPIDGRSLLTGLVDLLLPGGCGGCGRAGAGWCDRCAAACAPRRLRLPGGLVVAAAGRYSGPLRTALLAFKERGRRDLAPELGSVLAAPLSTIESGPGAPWLVPAPSRRSAARGRGGDHVRRLCEVLAARVAWQGQEVVVAPALGLRGGARDSVGLGAAERAANLAGRLRPLPRGLPPPGTTIVLVDDVVTTGATLRACQRALAAEGIATAGAVVLCDATGGGARPTTRRYALRSGV